MRYDESVRSVNEVLEGISESERAEFVAGMAILNGSTWEVWVRGVKLTPIWCESVHPYNGASVLCCVTSLPNGRELTWVIATTSDAPTPTDIGVVTVVGGGTTSTITVNGVSTTAYKVSSYTPVVGNKVLLFWSAGVPYMLGSVTPPVPAEPWTDPVPVAAPPKRATSGQAKYPISDSGTWTTGLGWNGYYGNNTVCGSGYIPVSSGNWFYNDTTKSLTDKTNINKVQVILGPRLQVGNWNSAATVHFYTHSASFRGSGEPTRTTGPHNVSIAAGFPGGAVDLPLSVGTTLKSGGGLSIYGDPHVGFAAGSKAADAGTLLIDWSL
jgi:hypothetical protein